MADMDTIFGADAETLGAAVTDLRNFQPVVDAVNNFAGVFNSRPAAFASMIGRARTNTYAYSFFLPEDQYGPPTNIDLGDFMTQIISIGGADPQLTGAAQGVLDAINGARIHGNAGGQLGRSTSYFNIYFPASQEDANGSYIDENPVTAWTDMLTNYYRAVNPGRIRGLALADTAAAPSVEPIVNITNVYPDEISVATPVTVSMEVIGRNIAHGDFIVDQILPDGTVVRLDKSRIVTQIFVDGFPEWVNQWTPGVDDSDFTWEVELSLVTDGTTSSFELVESQDDVWSMAGRYRYPGSEEWQDVTVIFDDEGRAAQTIAGGTALASVRLEPGGEFQAYRSLVSPDGQIKSEPGTLFTWPEDGIRWDEAPAPSGQYQLGFRVEAFGGVTGFNSTTVTVNNEGVDTSMRGYFDDDWGFKFQRPADWTSVDYYPDGPYLMTANPDVDRLIFVYPAYDVTEPDLQFIANDYLNAYGYSAESDFTLITVKGMDALEFTYSFEGSSGTFTGRAFALYLDGPGHGFVFSAEALDPAAADEVYASLQDTLEFFDAQALQDQDTGAWERDLFTDNDRYPVPRDWMPGGDENGWWTYRPGNDGDSLTLAAITPWVETTSTAAEVRDDVLSQEFEIRVGYTLTSTDTYYGENHTWEYAEYTAEGANGVPVTGRLYVTLVGEKPYTWWFEAPADAFTDTFNATFSVMLDGFKADVPDAETEAATEES
jgi:hypothetical protein